MVWVALTQSWTYYLNENSPPPWVYSHLVIASKFPMPLTVHVLRSNFATYELLEKVLGIIEEGLEAFTLFDDD